MSKGRRNRERRRLERERATVHNEDVAAYYAGLTGQIMQQAGLYAGTADYTTTINSAVDLYRCHNEEIRELYKDNRELLRDWLEARLGFIQAF